MSPFISVEWTLTFFVVPLLAWQFGNGLVFKPGSSDGEGGGGVGRLIVCRTTSEVASSLPCTCMIRDGNPLSRASGELPAPSPGIQSE